MRTPPWTPDEVTPFRHAYTDPKSSTGWCDGCGLTQADHLDQQEQLEAEVTS